LGLVEGNTYIGLLVEESNTLLDWGNMVERETEAKSSGSGVTNPYRRTEHCDKIHGYRCDKEVGVIGVDVSKEHLITSRGRVRKYENNLKGYEEILKMKPCAIVLETQERLKEVRRMVEGQVPQDHVLLTIPGVGRLAAGIIFG
jgi:hypothetical protein